MTKHYPMTDAQKKLNRAKALAKYNEKIKEGEVMCQACCMPVKITSLFYHNKSKKHLANTKDDVLDIKQKIIKLAEELKDENHKTPVEVMRKIYHLIKDEYFEDDGEEKIEADEYYIQPTATNPDEVKFLSYKWPAPMKGMIDELIFEYDDVLDETGDKLRQQSEKVDNDSQQAVQQLFDIYRNVMRLTKVKNIPEAPQPKEEKMVKFINDIKKKEEPIQYLDEEFPDYDKFIKATDKAKYDCLEYIFSNSSNIFEEDTYKRLTNELEEGEDYNYIYEQVLICKKQHEYDERRNSTRISMDSEEEVEEEEEEDDD
jgi:hypothetical protein